MIRNDFKMMQDVNVESTKELRTIEIGQANSEESSKGLPPTEKSVVDHQSFGPDMSGSEDDEASEVFVAM